MQLRRILVEDGEELQVSTGPGVERWLPGSRGAPATIVETEQGDIWIWADGSLTFKGLAKEYNTSVTEVLYG